MAVEFSTPVSAQALGGPPGSRVPLVIGTLDTVSSNIANSETVVFNPQMGLLRVGDRLRLAVLMAKSGTTDTGVLKVRVGTAGTTADTQILSSNLVATANRSVALLIDFRLDSATSLQPIYTGTTSGVNGYSTVSSAAFPSAVTISNATTNSLFFVVSINSSSTNDTVALVDAQLSLIRAP